MNVYPLSLRILRGWAPHGQAKKYLVHDLLAAWQGYLNEGVDLPELTKDTDKET